MTQAKPFPVTKRQVWEAYKRVKANKGGAGVDGQTLEDFERDLGGVEFRSLPAADFQIILAARGGVLPDYL